VREHFLESGLTFKNKVTHEGYLRHLLVRRAVTTKEIMISLITTSEEPKNACLKELSKKLQQLSLDGKLVGFMHIKNDSLADVVKDQGTEILLERIIFMREFWGWNLRFQHFIFSDEFQGCRSSIYKGKGLYWRYER
jgi:hypothetical protein